MTSTSTFWRTLISKAMIKLEALYWSNPQRRKRVSLKRGSGLKCFAAFAITRRKLIRWRRRGENERIRRDRRKWKRWLQDLWRQSHFMRSTIFRTEGLQRTGLSFGHSSKVGQTTWKMYLLLLVVFPVSMMTLMFHLVFAFVDKEGIISESTKYVDEMAVID